MLPSSHPAIPLGRVALMAAVMLSLRERWQPVVERLADGDILILLPPSATPLRATLAFLGLILEAMGHPVTTLEASRFTGTETETQGQLL